MTRIHVILISSLLTVIVACGQTKAEKSVVGDSAKADAPLVKSPIAPQAPAAPKVEIEIGAVASTMTFDKTSLTVPAGAEVHLVLKDAKPGTLMHNWVLVKPGTEAAVAAAGLPAGPAGNYITPGPDVIAFTAMAPPGGTSEVTFQAPAAGSYPYICSFPGHYLMMKGTLLVTP